MDETIYQSQQARELIRYIHDEYGNDLEFLWQKSPQTSICRNPQNQKWYAAFMIVPKSKLGFDTDDKVEIIDLRFNRHEALDFANTNEYIFPGYHMNKANWITIILDNSMPTGQILELLDLSYEIAARR